MSRDSVWAFESLTCKDRKPLFRARRCRPGLRPHLTSKSTRKHWIRGSYIHEFTLSTDKYQTYSWALDGFVHGAVQLRTSTDHCEMTNVAVRGRQIWEVPTAILFSRTDRLRIRTHELASLLQLLLAEEGKRKENSTICRAQQLRVAVVSYSAMTQSTEGFDNLNQIRSTKTDWLPHCLFRVTCFKSAVWSNGVCEPHVDWQSLIILAGNCLRFWVRSLRWMLC
jgi:hypothetical protein